jgi:hypothetical protein
VLKKKKSDVSERTDASQAARVAPVRRPMNKNHKNMAFYITMRISKNNTKTSETVLKIYDHLNTRNF